MRWRGPLAVRRNESRDGDPHPHPGPPVHRPALLGGRVGVRALHAGSSGRRAPPGGGSRRPAAQGVTEITAAHLEQSIRFERALRFARDREDSSQARAGYDEAKEEFEDLAAEARALIEQHVAEARDDTF